MITMAKAITNGAQPMGAVGVSDKIYNAIVDNGPEHGVEFFHGYTYSGHPACVAASLATLDVYEKEDVFARAEQMSPYFIDAVFDAFQDIPIVTDVRADGMMAAFDLAVDKNPGVRGYDAQKKTFANGVHIKFTGDAGIVAPALIAEKEHIDEKTSPEILRLDRNPFLMRRILEQLSERFYLSMRGLEKLDEALSQSKNLFEKKNNLERNFYN